MDVKARYKTNTESFDSIEIPLHCIFSQFCDFFDVLKKNIYTCYFLYAVCTLSPKQFMSSENVNGEQEYRNLFLCTCARWISMATEWFGVAYRHAFDIPFLVVWFFRVRHRFHYIQFMEHSASFVYFQRKVTILWFRLILITGLAAYFLLILCFVETIFFAILRHFVYMPNEKEMGRICSPTFHIKMIFNFKSSIRMQLFVRVFHSTQFPTFNLFHAHTQQFFVCISNYFN